MPTQAPLNDLNLLKRIGAYSKINPEISQKAFDTYVRHDWYLKESLIGLALFDSRISSKDKKYMVTAFNRDAPKVHKNISIKNVKNIKIQDFVSKSSKDFFISNNINVDFLQKDPSLWNQDNDYKNAEKRVKAFKVTNDVAERKIALTQEFSAKKLTTNEEQFQYLLLSVDQDRKIKPLKSEKKIFKT